jgi:hypothetical protein
MLDDVAQRFLRDPVEAQRRVGIDAVERVGRP